MGISMIEKIYNSLMDNDAYGDLPETEEARKKLRTYVMNNFLSSDDEESYRQWMGLERTVSGFGMVNEQQGFIFGFNYAVELLTKGGKQYNSDKLDENIRNEYSTLVVGKINKMDKVEAILKELFQKKNCGMQWIHFVHVWMKQSMQYLSRGFSGKLQ